MQEITKEKIKIDRSEIWQNRLKWIMPILAITLAIIIWELLVKIYDIPHYLIPAPSKISSTFLDNFGREFRKTWDLSYNLSFFEKILMKKYRNFEKFRIKRP